MTIKNELLLLEFFKPIVPLLDILFSSLVVGPLVIIYWMSTWELYDYYISPEDAKISATISLIIGFIGQFVIIFFQDKIAKLLTFGQRKWINELASRLFSLAFAQTTINLWRGAWKFIDIYSPEDAISPVVNIVQNSIILMLSKTIRNSISTPFVVTTDKAETNYKIPTFFKRVVRDMSCS